MKECCHDNCTCEKPSLWTRIKNGLGLLLFLGLLGTIAYALLLGN